MLWFQEKIGSTDGDSGWTEVPLRLADEVALIQGADNHPMLYHPRLGKYVRLSPLGARVTCLLNGELTGKQIAELLLDRGLADSHQTVTRFLRDLLDADVLSLPSKPSAWYRFLRSDHMLKLPLPLALRRPFDIMVMWICRLPTWLISGSATVLTALAVVAVPSMWHFIAPPRLDQVFWPGFMLALFFHLSFHESAHAVVCQQYKVPIREVGVGLLYYLFPCAYVDRSDSHRVQQRIPRVAIAMAGPAADLIGAGLSAAVALTTAGTFRDTAVLLCMAQVANLVANLNPLMPSDGYHALETVLGELNLRKRASSYLLHRLTGKVLPSSLAYVGPKERTLFLLYSCLVSVYTLLVFGIGGLALARYVVF